MLDLFIIFKYVQTILFIKILQRMKYNNFKKKSSKYKYKYKYKC